ncbi:MAG: glucose 1-dehydrogenase [Pseudomonadota bacterium]|nr:glucose 1-dehydrogenase [Pseudomonadota bacterium]
MRLKDKVALVTGGGSGLGEAICQRFAEEGAAVVVTDINEAAANDVATAIANQGGKALALHQDVTDEARWQAVITETLGAFNGLNIVVNNAGIAIPGSVEDTSLADWQKTQSVNLDAVFLGTREAIKAMKDSGGSIINISSIEGIIGDPMTAAYNASKGGVRIFTKSAALHCADNGYNIRVNSIHPGYVMTPLVANGLAELDEAEAEQFANRILSSIPLGEMGQPVDIANGAVFLASDESRYMTGSELVIDGGYTAK